MPDSYQPPDGFRPDPPKARLRPARVLLWLIALVAAVQIGLIVRRSRGGSAMLAGNLTPHRSPGCFVPKMNPAAVKIAKSFLNRAPPTGWYGRPQPFFAGGNYFHRWNLSLGTGLLIHNQTDFYIPDVIPINFRRTYRQLNPRPRSFGIGTTDSYEIRLIGDAAPFSYIQLILADGARVYFQRISPGVGYTDAVYQSIPGSIFAGSRISWNGDGWDLAERNGQTLIFPSCNRDSRPRQCGLVGIRDSHGDLLTILRDGDGDLTEIIAPHGARLHFRHDRERRIAQITPPGEPIERLRYLADAEGHVRGLKLTEPGRGTWDYMFDARHYGVILGKERNPHAKAKSAGDGSL